ncbi:MAG: diguanylate cyclase [Spirochaetales bacterium]|nr:diguanylate cyclase [Spirochaetales bacterium]
MEKKQTPLKIIGELSLFSLIIGATNIIFAGYPGFFHFPFNPYIDFSLIIAAYYGKYYGFYSLIASAFTIAFPLPLVLYLVQGKGEFNLISYWKELGTISIVPFSVAILGVYVFGLIRDALTSRALRDRRRLKEISRDKAALMKEVKALKTVNLELEQRVSGQDNSLTTLYTQIQSIRSLDMDKALYALLETVKQFSGAGKCSIWEYNPDRKTLILSATLGWDSFEKVKTELPDVDCIEGWVVRNNTIFSAKMLLQYDNLRQMDTGRNLFTIPILAGRKVWGILNIEEMPFEKYNLYTERMIQLIITLSSGALEKALEYETVLKQAETNPITGLPSFIHFSQILSNELKRVKLEKGKLSIIIAEVENYGILADKYGHDKVLMAIVKLIEMMTKISENKARFFHYKGENQIVILYPNLDFDGTSLFSLNLLEAVNTEEWEINGESVSVDLILGYASLSGEVQTAEDLLGIAENLIEMQKI